MNTAYMGESMKVLKNTNKTTLLLCVPNQCPRMSLMDQNVKLRDDYGRKSGGINTSKKLLQKFFGK